MEQLYVASNIDFHKPRKYLKLIKKKATKETADFAAAKLCSSGFAKAA